MRRMRFAALIVTFPAYAQEAPSLPDQVVTATRIPTLIEQIPAEVPSIEKVTGLPEANFASCRSVKPTREPALRSPSG